MDRQTHGLVVGEEPPGKLGNGAPEHDGSEDFGERLLLSIIAFPGRSEPEPERGERALCDGAVAGCGEVVDLIEDEESEPVSVPADVPPCGVVRGHREVADLVMPSSEHTDIGPECRAEQVVPLSDEVGVRAQTSVGRRVSAMASSAT